MPPKPWEEAIKARQREIRRAWLTVAAELERENTRKTFNQKEARNDRPNYERISAEQARPAQRAASVYQSNLTKAGRQAPSRTVSSLRNVSCLGVVQHRSSSKMLLQPNAPDRMGRNGRPNSEMRRSGTSNNGVDRDAKMLLDVYKPIEQNKVLAWRIRSFVEAMPSIETERHQIKRDLAQRFTKQAEKIHRKTNGQEQTGPKRGGKDVER
ncbi:hypothetical protein [Xylella fastidiosa]|uniref:hypothetical protein n=1 Tax=Xylella fastidiosa TaxID=2371 RepID=UPI00241C2AC9|nr:hypothetical protein [Xylella fastidiosa]